MSYTTGPYDSEENEREYNPYPNPAIETIELYARLRQLRRALTDTRHAYANLVAACRAALTAHHDGEADPWAHVVDELPPAPPGHPLHHPNNDKDVGGGW